MMDDNHLGEEQAQYEDWGDARVLRFLTKHACRRLELLRGIEEQRHIALPATSEQQKFLLQLARELRDNDASAAEPNRCPGRPAVETLATDSVVEAQDAFDKLGPNDRSIVRDACKTLFATSGVVATAWTADKQSIDRKTQQEPVPGDRAEEGTDS